MQETPPSRPLSDEFNKKAELTVEEKLARDVSQFKEPDRLAYKDLVSRQEVAMNHLLGKLERERPESIQQLTRDIFDQHLREQGMHLRPKNVPVNRDSLMRSAKIEATQKIKITEQRRIELAGSRFLEEKIKFTQTVKFRGEFNLKAKAQTKSAEKSNGGKSR